ncbi:MAG TPA: hypothetical protein VKY73_11350 [Polyangiaceae bacterium]|nr:hypothetical protein [Polyangiaceae bacterium]
MRSQWIKSGCCCALVVHALSACGDGTDLYDAFETPPLEGARGGARAVPIGSEAAAAGAAESADEGVASGGSGAASGGRPEAGGGRGAQGGAAASSPPTANEAVGASGGVSGGGRDEPGVAGSAGSGVSEPSGGVVGCGASLGGAFAMGGSFASGGAAAGAGGDGEPPLTTAGGAAGSDGGTDSGGASGDGGAGGSEVPASGGETSAAGAAGAATTLEPGAPAIFFSEYVEGTGNHKALELAASADAVLDGCAVRVYANGSRSASRIVPLAGSLPAGATLVLCTSDVAAIVPNGCDRVETLPFNGDDAVVLECGGVVVDGIGRVGEDPGTAWANEGASTLDCTLRRRCTVDRGDGDAEDPFDPALEWTSAPTDSLDGLGVHCADE